MKKTILFIYVLSFALKLFAVTVYIGDPNSTSYLTQYPFALTFQNSLSQTIYLEDELTPGLLTYLTYRNQSFGDASDLLPIKIYIGITDLTEFPFDSEENHPAPWIHFDEFELVYEGTLNLSTPGVRDITVNLDTPFNYESGNLVLMTHRVRQVPGVSYNQANSWQTTSLNGYRTLFGGHNINTIDPSVGIPTVFSIRTNNVPNILLNFILSEPATITGIVTSHGTPITNVKLELNKLNTNTFYYQTYSNELGHYAFNYLEEGIYSITTEHSQFSSQIIDNIQISSGENLTLNIQMEYIEPDLNALILRGPIMPAVNESATYTVIVRNDGGISVSDYEARLIINTYVHESLPGIAIEPGETVSFTFAWTATQETDYSIYGEIILENDNIPENNTTNTLLVTVQPEDMPVAYIGSDYGDGGEFIQDGPIGQQWEAFMSQAIYLEEEIYHRGIITQISYTFQGVIDIPEPVHILLYASITDMSFFPPIEGSESFTEDWVPYEDFTLLYEGYIDFSGTYIKEINITLDTIFTYEGGNLVIMAYKPFVPFTGPKYDSRWLATQHDGYDRTSRRPEYMPLDITNPWNGFLSNYSPNITLFFNNSGTNDKDSDIKNQPIRLYQNFPNPFNPTTSISFDVKQDDWVKIDIYNIRGQKVKSLIDEVLQKGRYNVIWNGDDENGYNVASGVYFYRMRTDEFVETRRMLLMK